MSANNYILITGKKPLGYYEIDEMDYDTDTHLGFIGKSDELEEAIKIAKEYKKENYVEYGIDFVLIK